MIDGLLPAVQPRHKDILGIDELSRLGGGPVGALGNAHDLTGYAEVLKDGVPQEGSAIHHVQILHALADLVDGDFPVHGG